MIDLLVGADNVCVIDQVYFTRPSRHRDLRTAVVLGLTVLRVREDPPEEVPASPGPGKIVRTRPREFESSLVHLWTNSPAFTRRIQNVQQACGVELQETDDDEREAQKLVGKTVVVRPEVKQFVDGFVARSFTEFTWRAVTPVDLVGEISREEALSILRRVWSICSGQKRPHEKVDEIVNLLGLLETMRA